MSLKLAIPVVRWVRAIHQPTSTTRRTLPRNDPRPAFGVETTVLRNG